jgi:hypothetical protein
VIASARTEAAQGIYTNSPLALLRTIREHLADYSEPNRTLDTKTLTDALGHIAATMDPDLVLTMVSAAGFGAVED